MILQIQNDEGKTLDCGKGYVILIFTDEKSKKVECEISPEGLRELISRKYIR